MSFKKEIVVMVIVDDVIDIVFLSLFCNDTKRLRPKSFKVPRYLFFSRFSEDYDSKGFERYMFNKGSPDGVKLSREFITSRLKTFFNLLLLDVINSLDVRRKILNSSSAPFHPRSFRQYTNSSNGLSIRNYVKVLRLPKKFDFI